MSDHDGWSALFWNIIHDQPRALNRFVDVENFRNERGNHVGSQYSSVARDALYLRVVQISMVDPDYRLHEDYGCRAPNAYQEVCLLKGNSEAAFRINKAIS